jgi:hypothetical protein
MKITAFITFIILAITLILLPKDKNVVVESIKAKKAIQNKILNKTHKDIVTVTKEHKAYKNKVKTQKQESIKHLELEEVNQLIGDLDLEIESRDFVQRANEGSLSQEEKNKFEKLLTKRNKLFNHKVALLVKKAKAQL